MPLDDFGAMSQDPNAEARVSRQSPTEAPPSYETATTNAEASTSSSESRPFAPYTDDKERLQDTEADSIGTSTDFYDPAAHDGESSHSARRRDSKWSSFSKVVSSIAPSITAGNTILRTLCFFHKSQFRLVLTTMTLIQAYDAFRDSLLWEIHSNSSQLVSGNEEPLCFEKGFAASPNGSLICVGAYRKNQKRLIVIDTETGWIKMEHSLSATDELCPQISHDNSKVMVWNYGNGAAEGSRVAKIFPLVEGQEQAKARRVSLGKMEPRQAFTGRFVPDNKHLLTCTGTMRTAKETGITTPSVSICVYNEETGEKVRSSIFPYSPKFSSAWQASKFSVNFHFLSSEEWLLSLPDYHNPEKTCIFNARLGQTVAVFASQLTLSQKWQGGVSSPERIQVTYDKVSGIFTKMEVSTTMIPRGQTVTITKFALSANGGREKSVVRKAVQIRSKVLSCKHGDACGLSGDGSYMFVQQAKGEKIDIISLAL